MRPFELDKPTVHPDIPPDVPFSQRNALGKLLCVETPPYLDIAGGSEADVIAADRQPPARKGLEGGCLFSAGRDDVVSVRRRDSKHTKRTLLQD
jgi:hypothetical protein